MAKSQKRSSREAKKPKQVKQPAVATSMSFTTPPGKSPASAGGKKK